MALRLIREASDTPNVANTDDARMARYAYGGYDGYVKGRGTELGYKAVGSVFTVTSGVVVLQGWESEIDGNGIEIDVGLNATKRYHAVYYEVNGALGTAEIKETYQTTTYPAISAGDDLTTNTEGTARLLLYAFVSQNGEISSVLKKVNAIEYGKTKITSVSDTFDKKIDDAVEKINDELYTIQHPISTKTYAQLLEFLSANNGAFVYIFVRRATNTHDDTLGFFGQISATEGEFPAVTGMGVASYKDSTFYVKPAYKLTASELALSVTVEGMSLYWSAESIFYVQIGIFART